MSLLAIFYAAGALTLLPFFTGHRSWVNYLLMAIWPVTWLEIGLLILVGAIGRVGR